ncbi:hypothetical protein ElyMa_006238500 [Elysia marginata]|uniref:Peptidase S1 domain-containing protein n=1 Tax=Elysia marginata TaxID=1093978 RepID=A0AAV4H749_9GAST|nr:hypothetical protein ElyMa_006238500 [Elysia marginata]
MREEQGKGEARGVEGGGRVAAEDEGDVEKKMTKEECIDCIHQVQQKRPGGHHECEILWGREHQTVVSDYKWKNCKKNPGHEQFISAKDFKDNYLSRLQTGKRGKELRAMIDLTVRLRVSRTSQDRPDDDELAKIRGSNALRLGTGFIRGVRDPLYNKPCPCNECEGKVTRKHWRFYVQTALHVLFNTEEAKRTKVDMFYDDIDCIGDGRMKTVWGLEVVESTLNRDFSSILCVTHDDDLGERIKSAWHCWDDNEIKPQDLSHLDLLPSWERQCDPALIISHPHGQPKKITVGEVQHLVENNPLVKYNTATCAGSSGAPVFVIYQCIEKFRYLEWFAPVHCGSYTEASIGKKSVQEQLNYGYEIW